MENNLDKLKIIINDMTEMFKIISTVDKVSVINSEEYNALMEQFKTIRTEFDKFKKLYHETERAPGMD